MREWGFRGVKVHRLDAPADPRGLRGGAPPSACRCSTTSPGSRSCSSWPRRQYPDVTFIVPHLGSFADDWRAHQRLIDQLRRLPNVLADTSGVRRFDYLVQAVRRAGPGRLVFGSDGPWLHPGLELAKIRLLGLRPGRRRRSSWAATCAASCGSSPARGADGGRAARWVAP